MIIERKKRTFFINNDSFIACMTRITMQKLLQNALHKHYAVGAFNFCTIEILNGILGASIKNKAALIIETSEGEASHFGMGSAFTIAKAVADAFKNPIVLHLDHGKSFEACKRAIEAGYPSVHIDGSSLPFEKNIALTKKVVDFAIKNGVAVEGEIGHVGGSSKSFKKEDLKVKKESLTDPKEAKEFVERTAVDSLAVAIGSVHGVWKQAPNLDFKRLEKIQKAVKIPLVLHGGSGIKDSDIKKAIKLGIAKINANTEIRMAFTEALRKRLKQKPSEVVPYRYLDTAAAAVYRVIEEKQKLFGCTKLFK
jgi:fructose-bisphosphate aldolase class II